MDEWLTTEGLNPPEISMIQELKRVAGVGEAPFRDIARYFAANLREVVVSAVIKAREQGKCQCWPN
ncbi:hypothetical protein [Mesorhizobium sp. WSM2239]|uniref:Uncharacterized protein n=2 Tax=unclassified Mesorhizobium TaxID=325217 RepID=A0AAU8D2R5_9HYPH